MTGCGCVLVTTHQSLCTCKYQHTAESYQGTGTSVLRNIHFYSWYTAFCSCVNELLQIHSPIFVLPWAPLKGNCPQQDLLPKINCKKSKKSKCIDNTDINKKACNEANHFTRHSFHGAEFWFWQSRYLPGQEWISEDMTQCHRRSPKKKISLKVTCRSSPEEMCSQQNWNFFSMDNFY